MTTTLAKTYALNFVGQMTRAEIDGICDAGNARAWAKAIGWIPHPDIEPADVLHEVYRLCSLQRSYVPEMTQ